MATGIKLIWDLIQYKYIRGNSFREIARRNVFSGVPKFLLKLHPHAIRYMKIRIVDGISTSLWFEPLLQGGCLVRRLGIETIKRRRSSNMMVTNIIP